MESKVLELVEGEKKETWRGGEFKYDVFNTL
jgi:hypothetical protein